MAPERNIPTLDYAPPEQARNVRIPLWVIYTLAVVWSGVLGVAAISSLLLSPAHEVSVRNAAMLTTGTITITALLLRRIGRAGCVTAFIALAVLALAVLWLSINIPT